ncbi:hypothetical protein PTSG_05030 [Salpingoeca rosetta]|uniref:RAP domain-containing protein n=1 Tax=Salpingoeca rosetta (strain ATCC 50818 / BSB-021) TaxID=946362 RepID=F2U9B1_SALR5|nr:uncharacterized protein PTSG_05030 [Salpingoeca rosetta]EGD73314.1 hypothetical protein PTSG_05030 [Salpingoeca rosetta]|eukprot:XP_004994345.1 hypothetical protein PTSG_05030 [Salpingoeca rosetta]
MSANILQKHDDEQQNDQRAMQQQMVVARRLLVVGCRHMQRQAQQPRPQQWPHGRLSRAMVPWVSQGHCQWSCLGPGLEQRRCASSGQKHAPQSGKSVTRSSRSSQSTRKDTTNNKSEQQDLSTRTSRQQVLARLDAIASLRQQPESQPQPPQQAHSTASPMSEGDMYAGMFDAIRSLVQQNHVDSSTDAVASGRSANSSATAEKTGAQSTGESTSDTFSRLTAVLATERLPVLFHVEALLKDLVRSDIFLQEGMKSVSDKASSILESRCVSASPLELVMLSSEIADHGDPNYVRLLSPIITPNFAVDYAAEALVVAQRLARLVDDTGAASNPASANLGPSIAILLDNLRLEDLSLEQLAETLDIHVLTHHRNRDQFSRIIRTILAREAEDDAMACLHRALNATFKLKVPLDGQTKRIVLDRLKGRADRASCITLIRFCSVNRIQPPGEALKQCYPHLIQLAKNKRQSWHAAPFITALANARVDIPDKLISALDEAYASPNTPWPTLTAFVFALIVSGKFTPEHWPLVERVIVGYRQRSDRLSTRRAFPVLSWVFWQSDFNVPHHLSQAAGACLHEMIDDSGSSSRVQESQMQRDIVSALKGMNMFERVDVEAKINGFVVDIFIPDHDTIIEVDGLTHFVEVPHEDASERRWKCTQDDPLQCIRDGAAADFDPRGWDGAPLTATMRNSALITNGRTRLKMNLLKNMGYTVITLPFFVFRPTQDKKQWGRLVRAALTDAGVTITA